MRRAPALVLLLVLIAPEAHAQLTAGAGVEYFHWREQTSPIEVTESGPLLAVALGLAQPGNHAVRVAYQGHGGIGIADYHGSFLLSPRVAANSTTVFAMMRHEAQVRVRSPGSLEAVGALAFEWWHRQLSARQQEDYQTISMAMGLERADRQTAGWSGGGGLRVPLAIREDAHFTDLGYDRNPILEPGKRAGLFGSLRYRFVPHLCCVGSFERFSLGKSEAVALTMRGGSAATATQPATSVIFLGVSIFYTR